MPCIHACRWRLPERQDLEEVVPHQGLIRRADRAGS